ncbi:hypothetical protein D3C72_1802070 [compost metagenome]
MVGAVGQFQQARRHARVDGRLRRALRVVERYAQARADLLHDQLHAFRMRGQDAVEVALAQHHQFRIAYGEGVVRARLAVQQRDLAEPAATPDHRVH